MGYIPVEKPHAVLVPYPAQGHITPMMKLAKLLHSKGFHITFVNTEYNHQRLVKSQGSDSVAGFDGFRFDAISDGLPFSDADATQDVLLLCTSLEKNCIGPFRELIDRLNETCDVPKVTCVVSDIGMSFTLDVAKELGISHLAFLTASACSFMAYNHFEHLISRGLVPLKSVEDLSNGFLDTEIDFIPGMKNMRLRDIPTFVRTTNVDDYMLQMIIRECRKNISMSTAMILNTYDVLESNVLNAIPSLSYPPVYTIGPLHLLAREVSQDEPNAELNSSLSSMAACKTSLY